VMMTQGTQLLGSSINISGLTIRTTGFTAGCGFVHVDSVVGTGSASVQPFSVVKTNKGALTYAFLNDVTPAPYTGPTPFNVNLSS